MADDPKARVRQILKGLAKLYPDAHCALNFKNPLQLLIATILSAQCTDVRVNLVTPALFARYPDTQAFADADIAELERLIQSTGFFRNKAKSIKTCCQRLVENHGGNVPATLDELTPLPGVGRKTANVVLGNAYDIPGITVDTHVGRLSRRMGFTTNDDAVKVEHDLMELIPKKDWTIFSHRMIYHGRQVCVEVAEVRGMYAGKVLPEDWRRLMNRRRLIVAFRSAKGNPFAERKATISP